MRLISWAGRKSLLYPDDRSWVNGRRWAHMTSFLWIFFSFPLPQDVENIYVDVGNLFDYSRICVLKSCLLGAGGVAQAGECLPSKHEFKPQYCQ
jgi:hypothetical protein